MADDRQDGMGEQGSVQRVTEALGIAFIAATTEIVQPLITDDSISPDDFNAGLTLAHILGAASAIVGCDGDEEVAIAFLRNAVLEMRADR